MCHVVSSSLFGWFFRKHSLIWPTSWLCIFFLKNALGNDHCSISGEPHIGRKNYLCTPCRVYALQSVSEFNRSVVSDSVSPWTAACQDSLSFTNSKSFLKLMSIESVMPSSHFILCHPLLPPSVFHSIRVSSNESDLRIRWPKYWSLSFSISPSNEYSWLISFRIDWLDLLAAPGTLRSLLQHHISEASILWCSAFFMIQLSHPYMTTGKTIALTAAMALLLSCFSCVWLCETPQTAAHLAPPSLGFSRQEYWSGLPLPLDRPLSAQ